MSIPKVSPNDRDNKGAFKFSGCRNSIINQKQAIEAIIAEMTPAFFKLNEIEKIERIGTKAIRNKVLSTNPMEYISQLRLINGTDCVFSQTVPEARRGSAGKYPVYYWLDRKRIKKWQKTLIAEQK